MQITYSIKKKYHQITLAEQKITDIQHKKIINKPE